MIRLPNKNPRPARKKYTGARNSQRMSAFGGSGGSNRTAIQQSVPRITSPRRGRGRLRDRLRTDVFGELLDSEQNPMQAVYDVENFLWDEPETVTYDPPFTIPSGGSFNLTCDWTNTTGDPVGFGTSVNDEMCFFWAYHYQ